MLHSLTVSNIVLIERLTLSFEGGLTVLTGETEQENPFFSTRSASRSAAAPISG